MKFFCNFEILKTQITQNPDVLEQNEVHFRIQRPELHLGKMTASQLPTYHIFCDAVLSRYFIRLSKQTILPSQKTLGKMISPDQKLFKTISQFLLIR